MDEKTTTALVPISVRGPRNGMPDSDAMPVGVGQGPAPNIKPAIGRSGVGRPAAHDGSPLLSR
jgi:hypothetical protein